MKQKPAATFLAQISLKLVMVAKESRPFLLAVIILAIGTRGRGCFRRRWNSIARNGSIFDYKSRLVDSIERDDWRRVQFTYEFLVVELVTTDSAQKSFLVRHLPTWDLWFEDQRPSWSQFHSICNRIGIVGWSYRSTSLALFVLREPEKCVLYS